MMMLNSTVTAKNSQRIHFSERPGSNLPALGPRSGGSHKMYWGREAKDPRLTCEEVQSDDSSSFAAFGAPRISVMTT